MKKILIFASVILAVLATAAALTLLLPKAAAPAGTAQSTQGTQGTQGTEAPPPPMPEPTAAKYFKFEYFGQIVDMQTGQKLEYYTISARNIDDLPEVLVIPSEQNGIKVRYIADGGFKGAKIKKLVIPDTVQNTGKEGFSSCTELESAEIYLDMSESGFSADDCCFDGCTSLKSVKFHDITEAEQGSGMLLYRTVVFREGAFRNCTSLESINIPASTHSVAERAFENCTALRGIALPRFVYHIDAKAFVGSYIESVTVAQDNEYYVCKQDCLIEKKSGKLIWCKSLESVPSDGSVTHIESFYMLEKTGTEEYIMPDFVKSIGEYAFENCKSLRKVKLSEGLEEVPPYAFYGLEKLESVDFAGVTRICEGAFFGCDSLSVLSLPDTLTEIMGFSACPGLTELALPKKLNKLTGFGACRRLEAVSFPASLRTLNDAFCECPGITSVSIPSAGRINNSFNKCEKLMNVSFSSGPAYIGNAFNDCTALSEVVIAEGTETISSSFNNCRLLTKVTLPATLMELRSSFAGCPYLTDIYYCGTVEKCRTLLMGSDLEGEITVHCEDGDLTLYFGDDKR